MFVHTLTSFIETYGSLMYLIAFIAILVEGDISLLVFGALSREHILKFSYILPLAIVAALIHDISFWYLGTRLRTTSRTKFLSFDLKRVEQFLSKMRPNIGIYVLLSKFAWNFNRVALVSSGYVGMELKRLVRLSLLSGFLWSVAYMSIGYVFADQTDIFRQRLHVAGVLMLVIIAVIALFEIYLKKIIKRYVLGNENQETPPSQP